MATSTISSMNSEYIDQIREDTLFVAREMNLAAGLVTNYTGMGWSNRKMAIYPTLTASSVGETDDFANPTEWTKTNEMNLTPGEVIVQVIITDRRQEEDPDGAIADASREMGMAVATKIDTDVFSNFDSFGTGIGASGSEMSLKYVAAAISRLQNAHAPNPHYVVQHPYHWYEVWVDLGQPEANQAFLGDMANEAMRNWAVGDWMAAQWFVSSNTEASGTDRYAGVFHREALALDTRRRMRLEPERDASKRATELNLTAGYAHGVRRDEFGIYILADATAPTGT